MIDTTASEGGTRAFGAGKTREIVVVMIAPGNVTTGESLLTFSNVVSSGSTTDTFDLIIPLASCFAVDLLIWTPGMEGSAAIARS
jgi:hypothetical protein